MFSTNRQLASVELISAEKFNQEPVNYPALAFAVHIVDVELPVESAQSRFEFQAMLMHVVNAEVTITNTFPLRFGQIWVSSAGRLPS